MPLRLTRRDQRGAALMLAVLCLIAAYFIGIHWWFTAPLQSISADMEALRAQHQRYQALEHQRPLLEAQLVQARNLPASNDSLLPDSDAGAATAQLMQQVASSLQALPAQSGVCTMSNRMPLAVGDTAPYRQVKVSINLDCAIEPLVMLLHGLENQHISLFVEALSIRQNPAQTPENTYRLAVQLQIGAYLNNPPDKNLAPANGEPPA
ncbi:general secretion pathway protein GspM [Pseudomonas agarici]|uniref:General secretion pathway protein GspM n=1 Tax=Pseudomonas agarici TaxID=46677 RepID=A0A0X1T2H8_PSEAA|nr:type II secretion system protein GspM [Pseudomonas agarici]AMB86059.1 general secretion pathway protein GspM [Pseudomonas agarici]NWB92252.1 general secretion pathway protein GspM [Pseudomonas agarici]NWC07498.1 general secretion pathway protein GspM [Pseudomonas agarici]SEK42362.1 type II secretion system protein M (GspM) [Pseudomonas agarici]